MSLGLHLARWDLVPDGEPTETPSSLLLAVRHNGQPAMLKIAHEEEERRGGALMAELDAEFVWPDRRTIEVVREELPEKLTVMVVGGNGGD